MNPAHDPVGLAEGRALLAQLPNLYLAVFQSTQLEHGVGNEVRCSFELPSLGKRTRTASTAREAIHAILIELSDILTHMPLHEWPKDWVQQALPATSSTGSASVLESEKAERFQSKARQLTIGVTLPVTLKQSLSGLAEQQGTSFADVARQLVAVGYDDFDDRSFSEGSEGLLSKFVSEVGNWLPSDTEQVMLRLEPSLAVRLRSSAKEYRRSASEFGAMCLAHGLVLQTQLVELEQKVAAFRGAAVRKLAPQVGLGTQAALLSGVLAGSIRAPKKVLRRLSEVFEATELALTEFFRRSFESRAVPAFKAEKGKPQVSPSATSWEDAVKSLNLPADRAKELLQLDE
ncbi:hypothetical protein X899_2997 [Burkholderia pseudomallei TSV 25]|uniref:hypothetical protein n=1 Tax=Burkholderia pseudomallei TaxID=28450 RepID=UPI00050FF0AA|nr:hypothetical protein [Burkholderia pseudomallei]AIV47776.1 hypothetical protein X988_771 [Burkholderia pseudomallei TSV 48]KGC35539.1 hypothetical protein DO64_4609 [Burkholderia pseudomallei]KGW10294.1 hypothetical protein X899_2997 [Burkholderia pseudomallei TSV 25]